ncbi:MULTISPECIES: siderophore-interacting protein [Thalassospira]|uniref:Siderophore-interacting protein n=2 Tax=Thalassospira TaxID=168934 RepID=A0AB72UES5_9PROT|nr:MULTISPECIES: siderophore-interacting protein [Thalassospira]AJD52719.1 siderophore-interacting protein [Thalassospira xiamenensis M-5 = DSM 17429]KEO57082.1 siderophore-interacting protein [Thalassospira permensis NBRC 106175]SIT29412.1 NADPH-dependent ferric siderophore reductase, contains FAD-binding and SIP domains [Thalassospira xiamenensis M-5 = DSM 17429]
MTIYTADAAFDFPDLDGEIQNIIDLLCAHNMEHEARDDGSLFTSPLGTALLVSGNEKLHIHVEATEPLSFNRLKHDLTILIDFITQPDAIQFDWSGDAVGTTLAPDLRIIEVLHISQPSAKMRRIRFRGENLERYAAPDQIHCRLMFPNTHTPHSLSAWPRLDDNGKIVWPQTGKLESRIYTIRKIDTATNTLDIDFVLHDAPGPGISWVNNARPGDVVGMFGPAGNGPKPAGQYLLIGDETGLPGIARILEGLPANACGNALVEVSDICEKQDIRHPEGVQIHWLYRNGAAPGTTTLLLDRLRWLDLSAQPESLFCWVGTEYVSFRDIRSYLRTEIGIPKSRLVAFAHWRRGMSEENVIAAGPEQT